MKSNIIVKSKATGLIFFQLESRTIKLFPGKNLISEKDWLEIKKKYSENLKQLFDEKILVEEPIKENNENQTEVENEKASI